MESSRTYYQYSVAQADAVVRPVEGFAGVPNLDNVDDLVWKAIYASEQLVAALALVALLPLLLFVTLSIWILSGQGPLIAHRRVGYRNEDLWVLKFRTMWTIKERTSQGFQAIEYIVSSPNGIKMASDCRITSKFAKLLRKYSIDELPQLFNVVRGQMTLIGPRPITEQELHQYYGIAASAVLRVKPGISGLWQVAGRSNLSYEQRAKLDIEWVNRRSPALYAKTLLQTVPAVLGAKGAW